MEIFDQSGLDLPWQECPYCRSEDIHRVGGEGLMVHMYCENCRVKYCIDTAE